MAGQESLAGGAAAGAWGRGGSWPRASHHGAPGTECCLHRGSVAGAREAGRGRSGPGASTGAGEGRGRRPGARGRWRPIGGARPPGAWSECDGPDDNFSLKRGTLNYFAGMEVHKWAHGWGKSFKYRYYLELINFYLQSISVGNDSIIALTARIYTTDPSRGLKIPGHCVSWAQSRLPGLIWSNLDNKSLFGSRNHLMGSV